MNTHAITKTLTQFGYNIGEIVVTSDSITTSSHDGFKLLIVKPEPAIVVAMSSETLNSKKKYEILKSLNTIQTNSLAKWMISCNMRVLCQVMLTSGKPSKAELSSVIQIVTTEMKEHLPELLSMYKP